MTRMVITVLGIVVAAALAGCSGQSSSQADQFEASTARTPRDPAADAKSPLQPLLQWAKKTAADLEKNVQDYSATFVKSERISGKLNDQSIFLKVREKPFSVYSYVLEPTKRKGAEAIYVDGKTNGKVLVHDIGITGRVLGTMSVEPTNSLVFGDQLRPITDIGMLNLCRRLAEFADKELGDPRFSMKTSENAKVNDRPCTCMEVSHPGDGKAKRPYVIRVFVDKELHCPIRYECYEQSATPGEPPELKAQYSYIDLKLNNGFTDTDFDAKNPKYSFP